MEPAVGASPTTLTHEAGGAAWRLTLDRSNLLPGRLVEGTLEIAARRAVEARAVVVALIGREHWRHRVTRTDAQGNTHTEVVTSREEHRRVPVNLHGPLSLGAGETWQAAFELPVPPMGPASLEADDAGLEWTVEAKLDVEGGFDSRLEAPIIVAQPTALLRAGAVAVGAFGLYESADVAADGIAGSIHLDPVPLVCGEPFSGRLRLGLPGSLKLQEIRVELRVEVEATVANGERETITAWGGQLAAAGSFGGTIDLPVAGTLDARPLPTVDLPHGRATATFHVILARAWAPDVHLVRDIALATTREL
jgi:hypothetical protein